MSTKRVIWTVGHSTRTLEDFLGLLSAHKIRAVADVRSLPGSDRYPQFNKENLSAALSRAGIAYEHLPLLGGLRRARPDSPNAGWRNKSFQGYADYMSSKDFERGVEELESLAAKKNTSVMCAEAVPWRCHRSLLADALSLRGWEVLHITGKSAAKPHTPTEFLRKRQGKLFYPASD